MNENVEKRMDDRDADGPPRWVKVFGIVGLLLVITFAVLHLTGNGFGRHMHGGDAPREEQRGE